MNSKKIHSQDLKMTEWQKIKLGDICDVVGGGTPSTKVDDYWNGNIPWLTPKDLSGYSNRYISKGERSITEKGLQNSSAKMLPKGTVLLTSRAPIGYVAIANNDVCTNQGFKSIVLNRELFSPEFFYYLLKNNIDYVVGMASGSTFAEISGSQVKNLEFEVPPLEIQWKIAGILGALDDKIEVLREQNKTLEKMAQAVFQSWFVDFDIVRAKAAGLPAADICKKYHITPDIYDLFPSAFSADNLPLGWEKKKLGDLAFNASETHTAQGVEKLIFINTSDVENGAFLHNKYSVRSEMPGQAKKSIKENDILYSEIRPINKHFAFVNFDSKDYIVSTKFMIIRSFDINNVFYIYFFLTLKETLNSFQALAENRSGTFPQITFESISKTEIVFSNRELHWYFSDYLKKTYTKIFENEKQIRTLEQTRDTLLPQLISGKIEV